jgi:hypothetical protein
MIETTLPGRALDPAPLLEQVARLRRENAALRAENGALRAESAVLHERVQELEARLGQTSANSSRPPSSDPLQARLGRLLRRGQKSSDRKAAALCRQLTKWWPALWTFTRVDGVEPTNNVAERALRPAVLWRKGSFGSDSEAGSLFAERLLTVVATCRQQGRRLLDFLVAAGDAALGSSAPPSLLPAL